MDRVVLGEHTVRGGGWTESVALLVLPRYISGNLQTIKGQQVGDSPVVIWVLSETIPGFSVRDLAKPSAHPRPGSLSDDTSDRTL